MRPTTEVWAQFESKGHPDKTMAVNGTVKFVCLEFVRWITSEGVYLTTNITLNMARTAAELEQKTRRRSSDAMESIEDEFARLLEAEGVDLNEHT